MGGRTCTRHRPRVPLLLATRRRILPHRPLGQLVSSLLLVGTMRPTTRLVVSRGSITGHGRQTYYAGNLTRSNSKGGFIRLFAIVELRGEYLDCGMSLLRSRGDHDMATLNLERQGTLQKNDYRRVSLAFFAFGSVSSWVYSSCEPSPG